MFSFLSKHCCTGCFFCRFGNRFLHRRATCKLSRDQQKKRRTSRLTPSCARPLLPLLRQVYGLERDRRNVDQLQLNPPEKLSVTHSDADLLEQHRQVHSKFLFSLALISLSHRFKLYFYLEGWLRKFIVSNLNVLLVVTRPHHVRCLSHKPVFLAAANQGPFHLTILPSYQVLLSWKFEVKVEKAQQGDSGGRAPVAALLLAVPVVCGVRLSVQVRKILGFAWS